MEALAAAMTVVGMLLSVGISYGITKANQANTKGEMFRIETELLDLRETCIRKDYMHAVTDPLREHIKEIQRDIKEILRRLSTHE